MPRGQTSPATKIIHELQKINDTLVVAVKLLAEIRDKVAVQDTKTLIQFILTMPPHLQKTCNALLVLGRARADQISDLTHRARAVESSYCNQLVRMGRARWERKGRQKYFILIGGDTFKA